MVKPWFHFQEISESESNTALLTCFGVLFCVCMLVCVVHEKKISSTNGKFFLSWIRLRGFKAKLFAVEGTLSEPTCCSWLQRSAWAGSCRETCYRMPLSNINGSGRPVPSPKLPQHMINYTMQYIRYWELKGWGRSVPQAKWLAHEQEGVKITRWYTVKSFEACIHAPLPSQEQRRGNACVACTSFTACQWTYPVDPPATDKNPISKHLVLLNIRLYTSNQEKWTVSRVSMDAANWPWLLIRGCGFSSSMVELI